MILLLLIFVGGSFIIFEFVCGFCFIVCLIVIILWKDLEFVFDFLFILGRNDVFFVDLNFLLESFRGVFLFIVGRLLVNVVLIFEVL